jgi:hypothetical protein
MKRIRQHRVEWPNGVKIHRRACSFALDRFVTSDLWCTQISFLVHGWKQRQDNDYTINQFTVRCCLVFRQSVM